MAETQYEQGDKATSSMKVTVSSSQATRASTDLAKPISSITDTAESTIIHGVVTKISAMKLSKTKRKYYFGTVSDESSSKRFLSFNTAIVDKMKTFHESSETVELQNCSVQRSSLHNAELEIMLNNKTNISPSPKKFKVDVVLTPNFTGLSQLATISINQVINIFIKVSKIEEPTQVLAKTKTLTKQDCTVNDATGTTGIILWKANVNKLDVGSSYRIMNVRVKEYNHQKYISLTPESIIEAISDIGEVQTAPTFLNVDEISPNIIEGEIVSLNTTYVQFVIQKWYKCCLSSVNVKNANPSRDSPYIKNIGSQNGGIIGLLGYNQDSTIVYMLLRSGRTYQRLTMEKTMADNEDVLGHSKTDETKM
uniref:Replication protein A OB domain-containing protein n=1 Tax=Amphimedon queenslandica TaxID=400682 RepID=A0A1X7U873_AMPQE